MLKCIWIAPVILLFAGCSRTVPSAEPSQSASAATAKPEQNRPVETAQTARPPVIVPAEPPPAAAPVKRPPAASHVEREPVVANGLRRSVGEADRMAPARL